MSNPAPSQPPQTPPPNPSPEAQPAPTPMASPASSERLPGTPAHEVLPPPPPAVPPEPIETRLSRLLDQHHDLMLELSEAFVEASDAPVDTHSALAPGFDLRRITTKDLAVIFRLELASSGRIVEVVAGETRLSGLFRPSVLPEAPETFEQTLLLQLLKPAIAAFHSILKPHLPEGENSAYDSAASGARGSPSGAPRSLSSM